MAYTLTLLGTDTQFTPYSTEEYPKGETLSVISSFIATKNNHTINPLLRHPLLIPYYQASISVINGPEIFGTDVGQKIATAVIAILDALIRSETQINIIAHSRGAIEAIIVAHFMHFLKITLMRSLNYSLYELLTSSKAFQYCAYTTEYFRCFHESDFEFLQKDIIIIQENITQLKLSLFNLDPVPGGSYLGINYPLEWFNPYFYQIPPIVKHYEQYIYENEHSRCFKTIIPRVISESTYFICWPIPGHHGTGSGNFRSQQQKDIPEELGHTEDVQKLLLLKLILFLDQHGVIFKTSSDIKALQYSTQDIREYIIEQLEGLADPWHMKSNLLNTYHKIAMNKKAYTFFDKTAYAVLGQEQSIKQYFCFFNANFKQSRIVYHEKPEDTFLEDLYPPYPTSKIINHEHAVLLITIKPETMSHHFTPIDTQADIDNEAYNSLWWCGYLPYDE
jgi:hypothetical protein